MKIKVCDKCKGTNIHTLVPKIKKEFPSLKIELGCIQYCGIGRSKIVILCDNKPIIGNNEEEIIDGLRKFV